LSFVSLFRFAFRHKISGHLIFPAFYQLIVDLETKGRDYTIVFRTFGEDFEDIKEDFNKFVMGRHRLFPNFNNDALLLNDENCFRGRYTKKEQQQQEQSSLNDVCGEDPNANGSGSSLKRNNPSGAASDEKHDDSEYCLYRLKKAKKYQKRFFSREGLSQYTIPPGMLQSGDRTFADGDRVFNSEPELVAFLESSKIVFINDDYEHWSAGNYKPSSGKPVWLNDTAHHIFFDDNIHNDPNDSIVAVRQQAKNAVTNCDEYHALSGEDTLKLNETNLVKVYTMRAILERNYFINKLMKCEANFKAKNAAAVEKKK
jgi:hypothetical protein